MLLCVAVFPFVEVVGRSSSMCISGPHSQDEDSCAVESGIARDMDVGRF